jgi:arylsulfatase A-like enzyme/Tfp pilus assembly protein PilF
MPTPTIKSVWPAVALQACLLACGGEAPGAVEAGIQATAAPVAPVAAPVTRRVDSILLVTVDTLRQDALGFNGNTRVATPVLDRLAARGVVFDSAYAHNVVTLPSHVNILTGLLPYQHGVRDNSGFVVADSVTTAASWLGERGFATAAFVAAYPLDRSFGLDRGFGIYDDHYPKGSEDLDVIAERRGDEVVAPALAWWRSHSGSRRFLWVHLYDPHAPYEPPQPAADPYLGEVSAVDGFLAPLLEPILAADENVLVVFTADHGEALGDHGELTHGLFAYEAVLRVPLVLWAPGLAPARRVDLAAHVDLLPTLLTAAGVEWPQGLAGRDLLAGGAPKPLYFESLTPTLDRGWAPLRGIRDGDYKFIQLPLPELYDVAADPAERVNLVDQRRDVARRLAAALPEESAWPPRRQADGAGEEAALRNLGYLGGSAPERRSFGVADDPKTLVHLDRKMHEAIDRFHRGNLEEAETLTREVLAERADMGAAYYYLSQILLAEQRLPEAIAVMERARSLEAASPALLRQLGLSLSEVGRFADAIAILEPLSRSGEQRSLNALGSVLTEAGDQDAAEETLRRLLARDPDNPEAYETLALVALRRGDPRQALAHARRATELNDRLSLAWSFVGAASFQLGERRQALAAWERAVALDPLNFDALFNITLVAAELGETARQRAALERFIATAPPEQYGEDIERARSRLRDLER